MNGRREQGKYCGGVETNCCLNLSQRKSMGEVDRLRKRGSQAGSYKQGIDWTRFTDRTDDFRHESASYYGGFELRDKD